MDAVDLTVEEGDIYGFLAPSEGDAIVAGASVSREPDTVRPRIGAALQATALDKNQTGREILTLQGRLYGLGRSDVRRRVEELADIGSALNERSSTYSGGMRRRLDLAAPWSMRHEGCSSTSRPLASTRSVVHGCGTRCGD